MINSKNERINKCVFDNNQSLMASDLHLNLVAMRFDFAIYWIRVISIVTAALH
ncbi:MAG: hypothetical protein H6937_05305 [Burkholderiales bacterium]|nr:hypothetical protein [Burkholderiales bacterium]